jgi:hypothetical protein
MRRDISAPGPCVKDFRPDRQQSGIRALEFSAAWNSWQFGGPAHHGAVGACSVVSTKPWTNSVFVKRCVISMCLPRRQT